MRRAAARPQKIAPDPGVIGSFEISDRRDGNDCPVCKDGDAVADGIERVEIVRDDEHRQAQRVAQRADEVVELAGADRIEPKSEEHTSELQSLMRISYAVFCLKNKKDHT